MPTDHAILAPSASKRWMACPPSARLEAQVPSVETSYTIEGTIAHKMAEIILLTLENNRPKTWVEDYPAQVRDWFIQNRSDLSDAAIGLPDAKDFTGLDKELFRAVTEAEALDLDPWEMFETVYDHYCRFVYEDFQEALNDDPDAVLLIEQRLKLDEYIPQGFGSSDAVLIYGDIIQVYDLKYGKGVKVSAKHNPQMMCYALGAILGPGEMYDLTTVRMTIIQPRLQWVSTDETSYWYILKWAREELRPAAVLAFQGGGDFLPGEHCRFCNVAPRCKALAAKAAQLNADRGDTALMTNAEIAEALVNAASLKSWLSSLEAYALERAVAGETFPGFKVVEGRSVRQISDQPAAMEILAQAGFDEASYCKPKELKTITDLEKLLKKKGFQELLGSYVVKPQGKPTLVEESDPRPAINSASEDFKDI